MAAAQTPTMAVRCVIRMGLIAPRDGWTFRRRTPNATDGSEPPLVPIPPDHYTKAELTSFRFTPTLEEVTAMFRDFPPGSTADDVVRAAEKFAEVGVRGLVTGAMGDHPASWLESTFGPSIDRIKDLESMPL